MLLYSGTVKGVKTTQRTNTSTGESWDEYRVGIASPKSNGYEGEQIIKEFKLTKRQIQNNLFDYYQKMANKQIQIEVFHSSRTLMNSDRVFTDWYFSGDGKPLSIDGKPVTLKAAS